MRTAMALLILASLACGPGSPGGPTMNNKLNDEPVSGPEIQSNDILSRDAVTNRSMVQHILVGWNKDDGSAQDARAAKRDRAAADKLAVELLARVRRGEDIVKLMAEYSEDPGSSTSGRSYEVTPDAQLVFEFKRLGLRLSVGETGLVLTDFGWHIIKRIE